MAFSGDVQEQRPSGEAGKKVFCKKSMDFLHMCEIIRNFARFLR